MARAIQPPLIDRLPPHSVEAEQAVLGCGLLDAKCLREIQGLPPEAFYDLRHRVIFDRLKTLTTADLIALVQSLKDKNQLEGVGGLEYVVKLPDLVVSTANLEHYVAILKEKLTLRTILQNAQKTTGDIFSGVKASEVIEWHVSSAVKLQADNRSKKGRTIKEISLSAMDQVERHWTTEGVTGIPTGFRDFDALTDGLHPPEVIVISAFPSGGKTALAMNIVEHVCVTCKQPVMVFSLEMSAEDLVKRQLASISGMPVRKKPGEQLTQQHLYEFTKAFTKITNSPLIIDDEGGLSVYELRNRLRTAWQEHNIKLAVIDYFQLLSAAGSERSLGTRTEELAEISSVIKQSAKEMNIPIIVLSQLTEKEGGKTTLRGGAELGQDSDVHIQLQADEDNGEAMAVDVWIRKQRNGPRNEHFKLTLLKRLVKFTDAAKIQGDDVPDNWNGSES